MWRGFRQIGGNSVQFDQIGDLQREPAHFAIEIHTEASHALSASGGQRLLHGDNTG
jgi:hypothetical protein